MILWGRRTEEEEGMRRDRGGAERGRYERQRNHRICGKCRGEKLEDYSRERQGMTPGGDSHGGLDVVLKDLCEDVGLMFECVAVISQERLHSRECGAICASTRRGGRYSITGGCYETRYVPHLGRIAREKTLTYAVYRGGVAGQQGAVTKIYREDG